MPLTPQDIARLAQLARLELSAAEGTRMCSHLNDFFCLVEKMQAVDTDGVEPLTHPVAVVQDVALQLAEDHIGQGASAARRQAMQANAPQVERGLFLVPKVIE